MFNSRSLFKDLFDSDDFAAAVLDEANDDGGSSEFDDFSDGDEQVNIIKVVNGIPSPVPPPPPAVLPPTEEGEEEAEAVVEAGGRLSRAESSPSPGMDALPKFQSFLPVRSGFSVGNAPRDTNLNDMSLQSS